MTQQQQVTMEQVQQIIGALYLEKQLEIQALRERLAELARRVKDPERAEPETRPQ